MAPLSTVIQVLARPGAAPPLHAPDGFFSAPLAIAGYVVAAVFVGFAVRRVNRELNERMVPMMGVMAAFIFAAQMLNFPVIGGTSGHLVGGALAAIILGPWAAVLVMTSVVGLQALLFQDGGLLVLGLTIVNVGVLSCLTGYAVFWLGRRLGDRFAVTAAAAFAAAWISVEVSAVALVLQLAASGTTELSVALAAMVGVHALIGVGEGLVTVGALSFIRTARKDLLHIRAEPAQAQLR